MVVNDDNAAAAPAPMTDNERQAAAIKASISTYVATAALAVLAGVLALFTWISQTFVPPVIFYVLMGAAAVLLVISIYYGGDGQDWLVNEVAHDRWHNPPTRQFNRQSYLTLFAICFLIAGTAFGATASRRSPGNTPNYAKQLRAIHRDLVSIDGTLANDLKLRSAVANLQHGLQQLTLRVLADESEGRTH